MLGVVARGVGIYGDIGEFGFKLLSGNENQQEKMKNRLTRTAVLVNNGNTIIDMMSIKTSFNMNFVMVSCADGKKVLLV